MRVLVHDYSGHPFQMQLSRSLARRGHDVLHVHCASYQTGKGAVTTTAGDPDTLRVEAIDVGGTFDRYSMVKRIRQELAYGGAFGRVASRFAPDVVLSSNDPLFAKARAARWCRRTATPWVFWLQDIYSAAMSNYASARLGMAGSLAGSAFRAVERRLLKQAKGVVAITADFLPVLRAWGIDLAKCVVIHNWAPIDELSAAARDNEWSTTHGLDGKTVVLYAGTLGLKHNPDMLVAVAERFRDDDNVRVVVVSEGMGADWLGTERTTRDVPNLVVLPYQPYQQLSEVLASSDVLVALLESDAGVFSVPSKVLSYLCVGRPILGAMPSENLAARTIVEAGAGEIVDPSDRERFVKAAERLLDDASYRADCGRRARAYAEEEFDIDTITDRFEDVLSRATAGTAGARP